MRTRLLSLGGVGAVLLTACGAGESTPEFGVAADGGARDVGASDRGAAAPDVVRADAPVVAPVDAVVVDDAEDLTPDLTPDGGTATVDVAAPPPPMTGGTMRVTATSLNLRAGVGTSASIVTSMPCAATVTVLAGPAMGWWNVRYNSATGWASGAYLVEARAFDAGVCAGTTTPPPAGTTPEVSQIMARAASGVGYSYYWGHGSWRDDGADHGSCSGSCPSCTHTGRYGADCSGFVAKCWQIPGSSPVATDAHPYATVNFYNDTTHWSRLTRDAARQGDALTYNSGGAGHIVLVDRQTDPWGDITVYEARGCAYGIVHDSRAFGMTYRAIRRDGL